MRDTAVFDLIEAENQRQREGLELIPSENYVSKDVLEALGSIFTNKYSEGYPGRRYYGGQEYTDQIEQLAIDRLDGLADALAEIACAAVAQFHRLMRAGGGARRHHGAAKRAVSQRDLGFEGGITAAVEDFTGVDVGDGWHGFSWERGMGNGEWR